MIEFYEKLLIDLRNHKTDSIKLHLDILEVLGYEFDNNIEPLLSEPIDIYYSLLPSICLKGKAHLSVSEHEVSLLLQKESISPFEIIFCNGNFSSPLSKNLNNRSVLDNEYLAYILCILSIGKYISTYYMLYDHTFKVELKNCIDHKIPLQETTMNKLLQISIQISK